MNETKLKIGILTFHASHNCGSMLQAFALQKYLTYKYDASVEIIDYSNYMSRCMYGLVDYRIKKDAIQNNIHRLLNLKAVLKSMKYYETFSNSFLVKSQKSYKNAKQLEGIENLYDVLITGGDQVWNVKCPDGGKEFYLNFAHNIKKISYSVSLGGTNINKYADNLELYKKFLSDFYAVSVREPNGKKWLEELTGREIHITCDPTLLISPTEWKDLLPIPEVQGDYIFNYAFFHNNDEINTLLHKISKLTNLPIFIMDYKSYNFYRLDKYGFKLYKTTGPLAFLGLMKNAKLVLTQSFHGTLFASLFNRNFWSYNIPKYNNPDDDRALAILEQLGIPDRYIMLHDLLIRNIMEDINYSFVNKRIEKFRNESDEFIKNYIIKNNM